MRNFSSGDEKQTSLNVSVSNMSIDENKVGGLCVNKSSLSDGEIESGWTGFPKCQEVFIPFSIIDSADVIQQFDHCESRISAASIWSAICGDNRDANPIKYIGRERLSYEKDFDEHYKEIDDLLEKPERPKIKVSREVEEKQCFNYRTYDREDKAKRRKWKSNIDYSTSIHNRERLSGVDDRLRKKKVRPLRGFEKFDRYFSSKR